MTKYTWQFSKRCAVKVGDDYVSVEIGFSRDFDDATTPTEIGYMEVKTPVEERMNEALKEVRPEPTEPSEKKEAEAKPSAVPETVEQPTPKPEPTPEKVKVTSVEDATNAFPPDLAGLLYFDITENYVVVKPRQFLGSDNFRKIASIVRGQLGGEYVSAGKDSHFRIPRSEQPPKTIGFMDEKSSKPKPEEIPEFDPEVLMQWSWKGKKKDDGTYAPGSRSYGWDFANNFPKSVIRVLEKGAQVIRGYRFRLDPLDKEKGTYVVHAREEKEEK